MTLLCLHWRQSFGTTRSAAAVELWAEQLEGSVVAIGNAPTALFPFAGTTWSRHAPTGSSRGHYGRLRWGGESKQALAANPLAVPYLTVAAASVAVP